MIGLTADKLVLVALLVALLFGPERLPQLAAQLGALVRTLRGHADAAAQRVRVELGPELDEIEWKKLDPRQYDPRQIVRTALAEPVAEPAPAAGPAAEPVAEPLAEPTAAAEPARMRRRSDGRLEPVEADAVHPDPAV